MRWNWPEDDKHYAWYTWVRKALCVPFLLLLILLVLVVCWCMGGSWWLDEALDNSNIWTKNRKEVGR